MSKTKGGGSTRNGRDSSAKRLGVKVYDGTVVHGRLDHRPPAGHPVPPRRERRPGRRRHAVRHRRRQVKFGQRQRPQARRRPARLTRPPRQRPVREPVVGAARRTTLRLGGRSDAEQRAEHVAEAGSPGRRSSRSCVVQRPSEGLDRGVPMLVRLDAPWSVPACGRRTRAPPSARASGSSRAITWPVRSRTTCCRAGVGRAQSARRRTSLASAGEPGRMASVQASRARRSAGNPPRPGADWARAMSASTWARSRPAPPRRTRQRGRPRSRATPCTSSPSSPATDRGGQRRGGLRRLLHPPDHPEGGVRDRDRRPPAGRRLPG